MQLNEWLELRELLNHDILCNQVRGELSALQAEQGNNTLVRLTRWPEREPEYRRWLDATVEALGPAQWLDSPAFACWDETMRARFKPALQELFLATSSVAGQVEALHELLTQAVSEVKEFVSAAPVARTPEKVAALQELLFALSAAISALPRNVCAIKERR